MPVTHIASVNKEAVPMFGYDWYVLNVYKYCMGNNRKKIPNGVWSYIATMA